ncbi:aspartate aminotransferase family protein, partial [Chloroflexota bacterium]
HSLGIIGQNAGLAFEQAEGIRLRDSEGKEYIDLASQLVNVNLGHSRKEIVDAAREQMEKMLFVGTLRGYTNVPSVEYAQKLAKVVPEGLDHFLFTMTGGDAVDSAFKIASAYYKAKKERRYKIISLFGSYHGTLRGTGGATGIGKGVFAECPPCGSHIHIPNYFCYRCPFRKEYPSCGIECAEHLDYVIENEGKDSVACFIAEPEQGAGGFISPPPEYFRRVREICDKQGVLFIADEVMTGFGRTGKMWGIDHGGVKPDIMAMSKGIVAGYLPFGAVAVSTEVFNTLRGQYFAVGSTESGNPVCCAVASSVLDIYHKENIVEHADAMGKYFRERLEKDFLPLPHVGSLSGFGLMIGIDIVVDKETKEMASQEVASAILQRGFENGLYMRITTNRLGLSPPLTITREEIDESLKRLYPIIAELKLK